MKDSGIKSTNVFYKTFLFFEKVQKKAYFILNRISNLFIKYKVTNNSNTVDFLDTIIIVCLGVLCYYIFIFRLDAFPLRMWDEARNSINALEMLKTKNIFVTYFNGSPDMWNTKPPLLIWIIAGLFKFLGISELSVRLPSAIAASSVVIAIYLFSKKILNERWIGLVGALILVSSMGFPDTHIGRTGDYDALLTLWTFLGAVSFFTYLESYKNKYIYISTIFWILAVLTKGIAGLFMMPGILIYLLFAGKLIKTLKSSALWKAAMVFVIVVSFYYIGRNIINPGYFSAIAKEELISRYGKPFSIISNDFWYYWNLMVSFRFQVWIYFVPASFLTFLITKSKVQKRFSLFLSLLVFTYFFIISSSESRNPWYDAQLYPLMSLLVAGFIISVIKKTPLIIRIIPLFILCFYMQRYIRTNYAYIHRYDIEKTLYSCVRYGYLFRNPPKDVKSYSTVHKDESYCMPYIFYVEKEGMKRKTIETVNLGDKILTCDQDTVRLIEEKFKTTTIYNNSDGCVGLQIVESTT